MKTVSQVVSLLKEGLSVWKTFISTREAAYKRKRDKQQVDAIEYGERFLLETQVMTGRFTEAERDKYKEHLKDLDKMKDKFFKYN